MSSPDRIDKKRIHVFAAVLDDKVETETSTKHRRTSWMGGSSDVKRINDNFFDSNTLIEPTKPMSSSATTEVLQAVMAGGNLKPTTYRGMKLGKIHPPI